MIAVIIVVALLGLTTAFAVWVAIDDADLVAAGVALLLVALTVAIIVAYNEDQNKLECETLIETKATIGDVEICIPTSDAVDIVEEYQNAD